MCAGNSTGLPSGTFRDLQGPNNLWPMPSPASISLSITSSVPSLSPWCTPSSLPPHSFSLPLLQSYTIHVVWCHNFIYHKGCPHSQRSTCCSQRYMPTHLTCFFFFLFKSRVLLCCFGLPVTHLLAQACLKTQSSMCLCLSKGIPQKQFYQEL